MTDPSPAVSVRDLGIVYQRGGEPAVHDLSFTLAPGEGLLIAGGEGSGKTSVLRAILGLVPVSGEVAVLGRHPGARENARRVGYGPQGRAFTEGHSARQILRLVSSLRLGAPAPAVAEDALERAGLPDARRASRSLDVEECRRVALACAIAADPDVIVLDDPWEFAETVAAIHAARDRGATVLAATHDPGGLPDLLGRTLTLVDGAAT